MSTEKRVIELLIASGNVTVEKGEQAYKLALSFKDDKSAPADGCQSHAWRASHTGFNFCPDCGNPLGAHR